MSAIKLPTPWIIPSWPVSDKVVAATSSRLSPEHLHTPAEGAELTGYQDFNLALHVGDNEQTVQGNRQELASLCSLEPHHIQWLDQVHSDTVVEAINTHLTPQADACYTRDKQTACLVMTADCLPVLFCNKQATQVAAAHAGWRGLASGILRNTVSHFDANDHIIAWLGPAISQKAFEVGTEVYQAFCKQRPEASIAFVPAQKPNKWYADLYQLARIELNALGVTEIYGGEYCTFGEPDKFYSYRRDGAVSGRMASLIYIR